MTKFKISTSQTAITLDVRISRSSNIVIQSVYSYEGIKISILPKILILLSRFISRIYPMSFDSMLEDLRSRHPKLKFEKVLDNGINELRISYFLIDEHYARSVQHEAEEIRDSELTDHFVVDLVKMGMEEEL